MTEKLDLEAIRREIDEADSNLINAFERRLQAVLRVAEYKKQNNLPVQSEKAHYRLVMGFCNAERWSQSRRGL